MTDPLTDPLTELATRQGGVVTVAQARLARGRRDVDRALREGELVAVTRGVLVPRERWVDAQPAPRSTPLTCRIVDERGHARRGPLASSTVRAVG